jgi:hypothetical protein
VRIRRSTAAALAVLIGGVLYAPPARADEHTYKSEHFALTWSDGGAPVDNTDADRDGIPDAVVRMTAAFERARAIEVDELGYQAPPTHGRYNLYVAAVDAHGLTRVAPGGIGRSRPSFIVIPPSMMDMSVRLGDVRAFAGHSYFHAIQIGYDAAEEPWIKEATAAWVEGLVAPGSHNNYKYLFDFVPHTDLGLASDSGLHEYGAFLFFQFVTERYFGGSREGAGFVRRLWEDLAAPEAVEGSPDYAAAEGVQRELEANGIALDAAWREFLLWNWQIRRFESGTGYARELKFERWPTAPETTVAGESCRVAVDAPLGVRPGLSGHYARLLPGNDETGAARLTVEGPPGSVGLALLAPRRGPSTVVHLTFGADGLATTDFGFGGTAVRRVTVALGNGAISPQPVPLVYSLRIAGMSATSAAAPAVPSSTIFGTGFTAAGQVSCGGRPAPFARVVLRQTEAVSGATHDVALVTDQFGNWSLTTSPSVNSDYTVQVADPLLSPALSSPAHVDVRVAVNIRVSDNEVADGEAIEVDGNIAPVHQGTVVVEIRRPNGQWQTAAETHTDDTGNYRASVTFPAPGFWEVRARMPDTGDADHAPGDSAPQPVQVGES